MGGAPYWDEDIRSRRYSLTRKRENLGRFRDNPTRETFWELANSLWANSGIGSIDDYVDRRVFGRTSPNRLAKQLERVFDGEIPVTTLDIPGMRAPFISEIAQAAEPDQFATLNEKSVDGMAALGYDPPSKHTQSAERYDTFVQEVVDAVHRYDLGEAVREITSFPNHLTHTDVADAVFHLHAEDEFDLDLTRI